MRRILVVEDDFVSRTILLRLLRDYGDCDVAVDGVEAVEAFKNALERNQPYNLLFLDIHMPRLDGQAALAAVRSIEEEFGIAPGAGAKIIMATADGDPSSIMKAFRHQCEGYIVKPIDRQKLRDLLTGIEIEVGR